MVGVKRKILSAEVTMVSLCKRGANTLKTLFKGDGARLVAMVKSTESFDERGELLGVVAVPGFEDVDGDVFASPEAIAKAAHGFMRHGAQLDMQHDLKPLGKDKAHVAESFIIQKGDPRFAEWKDYAGKPVDVTGGWGLLVKIDDEGLRQSYRSGEWDGLSLFAPEFEAEPLTKTNNDPNIIDAMRVLFRSAGLTNEEDDDVKPEDIKALTDGIVAGLAKALKPDEPKPTDKPKSEDEPIAFEGDPAVEADLQKHAAKIRRATLMKSGDLNDPAKIEELVKQIQAAKLDPKAEREALRKSDPKLAEAMDRADAASAEVAKLRKASNQTPGKDDPKPDHDDNILVRRGLLKAEDVPLVKAAAAAAKLVNIERGLAKAG